MNRRWLTNHRREERDAKTDAAMNAVRDALAKGPAPWLLVRRLVCQNARRASYDVGVACARLVGGGRPPLDRGRSRARWGTDAFSCTESSKGSPRVPVSPTNRSFSTTVRVRVPFIRAILAGSCPTSCTRPRPRGAFGGRPPVRTREPRGGNLTALEQLRGERRALWSGQQQQRVPRRLLDVCCDCTYNVMMPGSDMTKTVVIQVRLTSDEHRSWLAAADLEKMALSAWVRRRCNGLPAAAPVVRAGAKRRTKGGR